MSIYLADYLNQLPPGSAEHGEVLGAARALLDPRRGGKAVQLRQVTNRVGVPTTFSAVTTSQFSRSWQISYVPIRKIKLGWANWGVDTANSKGLGAGTETGPGGTMTISASVEYPRGTFTQLTWDNGATSGTIANGATGESDTVDLGFTLPPFRWFRIAVHAACPSGTWNMNFDNACDRAHGDEFAFGGANNTMNATVAGTNTTSGMLPLYVLGQSDLGVWGIVGDSIASSQGEDGFPDPSGGRGILGRGLAQHGPHINYTTPGDLAQNFVLSHDKRIAALVRGGVTRVIDQYGSNDFNGGRTATQVLADKAAIRSYIPGLPWFECTTTPKTTGTFLTAAAQAVWDTAKNTQRVAHNNAIRAGIAGVENFVDAAGIVETSPGNEVGPVKDGGVWIGGLSKDGTHQTIRASLAVLPLFQGLLAAHGS